MHTWLRVTGVLSGVESSVVLGLGFRGRAAPEPVHEPSCVVPRHPRRGHVLQVGQRADRAGTERGTLAHAVNAAIDAQRELQLPVRMGLATGEAELRDGDYFGTVLNRAARVMAAGHGGQILLAESTAGLLSGVDLLDLGPRRLRDVPTPVGVFQVRATGLRTDFPPLRALDVSPGNLRAASTSLI